MNYECRINSMSLKERIRQIELHEDWVLRELIFDI